MENQQDKKISQMGVNRADVPYHSQGAKFTFIFKCNI